MWSALGLAAVLATAGVFMVVYVLLMGWLFGPYDQCNCPTCRRDRRSWPDDYD